MAAKRFRNTVSLQHLRTIWKHLKISCFSVNVEAVIQGRHLVIEQLP